MYLNKEPKIRGFGINFDPYHKRIVLSHDSDNVATIDYKDANVNSDEILELFQHSGHCVNRLSYTWYRYDSSVHSSFEPVHKKIIKYVAESVSEIYFDLSGLESKSIESYRIELMVPFPNVKVVYAYDGWMHAETLNQLFPAVQSLKLTSCTMEGSLKHFPYLNHLGIPPNWVSNERSNLLPLEKTLELNPQIKHLSIYRSDHLDILKAVNKILPNLESLEFYELQFVGYENMTEPLRFPNMKAFKYTRSLPPKGRPIDRIPLEFGNLEEIVFAGHHLSDQWIEIMMRNKKLKRVTAVTKLGRDDLERIATGLPNLEEFTFGCYVSDSDDRIDQEIVEFVQSAKQLKKISFKFLNENQRCPLVLRLINEWHIIETDSSDLCFVRK